MIDHHALRRAAGAGGIDDVGRLQRVDAQNGRAVRQVAPGGAFAHADHLAAEVARRGGVAEQPAGGAVGEGEGLAFGRPFRVQRHIGGAGLEGRQQRHDEFDRALQAQADAAFRYDAALAQVAGQAIGLRVDPGKVVSRVLALQGQRLGRGGDAGVPQAEHIARREGARLAIQSRGCGSQLQFAEGDLRPAHHLRADAQQVGGQASDARLVEQVASVGEHRLDASRRVGDVQPQVEVRGEVVALAGTQAQAADGTLLRQGKLLGELHLAQRVVGEATGHAERFDQLIERQVLVGLRAQRGRLDLLQQRGEGLSRRDLAAQHQSVDEQADQALDFGAGAPGHRHADAQVVLVAVAVQERHVHSQHGHEQGGAIGAGQLAQRLAEAGVDAQRVARAAVALLLRTRTVGGQAGQRMAVAQPFAPVGQLPLRLAGRQVFALPGGEVGVLHRQGRQRRLAAFGIGGVEGGEVVQQHLHRPAVADDVVQHQQQLPAAAAEVDVEHAPQRPVAQVHRRLHGAAGQGVKGFRRLGMAAQVVRLDAHRPRRVDLLHQPVVLLAEGGTQAFVARREVFEAALQRVVIDLAAQAELAAQVIGAAVGLQLGEEPQALLGEGLLRRNIPRQRRDTCAGNATLLAGDHGAEGAQGRLLEQLRRLQRQPQFGVQAREHLHHAHRVAAALEEVVVGGQIAGAKHLFPGGQHFRQQRGCINCGLDNCGPTFRQAAVLPDGEAVQAAVQPAGAAGRALQLAAGGARQCAGFQQDDHPGRHHEQLGQRVAHGVADHLRLHQAAHVAADLQRQPYPFAAQPIGDREGGDAPAAQQLDALLQRLFQVLRVEVLAVEDDQVLEPAGDEQFALTGDAQIAGTQPALAVALDEGARSGLGVLPVALGDARTGDPDLADPTRLQAGLALRSDDAQVVVRSHPAATRQAGSFSAIEQQRLGGLAGCQRFAVEVTDAERHCAFRRADVERGFGQAVAGRQRARIEAGRSEALAERFEGRQADRFGAGERQAPGVQRQFLECRPLDPLDAQAIGEIRSAGKGAAVSGDRFQPARRAAEEVVGRHQRQSAADVQRQQQAAHQAHVVVERQPADPALRDVVVEQVAGHRLLVGQQVAVGHHHPFRRAGGAGGVLQEGQRRAVLRHGAVVRLPAVEDLIDGEKARAGRHERQ
ncbi:hypothetical protein D3C78_539390 [compost metagenome]